MKGREPGEPAARSQVCASGLSGYHSGDIGFGFEGWYGLTYRDYIGLRDITRAKERTGGCGGESSGGRRRRKDDG